MNARENSALPPRFPKHTEIHHDLRTAAQAKGSLHLGAKPDAGGAGIFHGAGDAMAGTRSEDFLRESHQGISNLDSPDVTRSGKVGEA